MPYNSIDKEYSLVEIINFSKKASVLVTYISTRSIPAAIKYYIELSVIKVKRPTDFIHIIEHAFGKEYITSREYKHFLLAWEYIENDLKLYNDFLEKIGEIPMRCDSMEEKVAALNYHKFNR